MKVKTQPIGLRWGTLDICDVRYNGNRAQHFVAKVCHASSLSDGFAVQSD
jgi:hypothetical protein